MYNKIIDKAREYALDLNGKADGFFNTHNIMGAFIAGANYALSHQWRSVEDELPNHNHLVLVKCEVDNSELCHATAYYENGAWHYPDDWYYDVPVLM